MRTGSLDASSAYVILTKSHTCIVPIARSKTHIGRGFAPFCSLMIPPTLDVRDWTQETVHEWLQGLQMEQYAPQFAGTYSVLTVENDIDGAAVVLLDDETLRDLGVQAVGHRVTLLSEIYRLKTEFGIPIEEGDWVPRGTSHRPCSSRPRNRTLTATRLAVPNSGKRCAEDTNTRRAYPCVGTIPDAHEHRPYSSAGECHGVGARCRGRPGTPCACV